MPGGIAIADASCLSLAFAHSMPRSAAFLRVMERMSGLSDHEGTYLSLVLRLQPTTAYQVAKIYEQSPVTNYKTHKGKMYAIIERLVARGLLEKRAVMHDRRGASSFTALTRGATRCAVGTLDQPIICCPMIHFGPRSVLWLIDGRGAGAVGGQCPRAATRKAEGARGLRRGGRRAVQDLRPR